MREVPLYPATPTCFQGALEAWCGVWEESIIRGQHRDKKNLKIEMAQESFEIKTSKSTLWFHLIVAPQCLYF